MTAPGPVAGDNPYTGLYQTSQFDTSQNAGAQNDYADVGPLNSLADPPQAAVDAATSPDHLFAERDDPPVGAGG